MKFGFSVDICIYRNGKESVVDRFFFAKNQIEVVFEVTSSGIVETRENTGKRTCVDFEVLKEMETQNWSRVLEKRNSDRLKNEFEEKVLERKRMGHDTSKAEEFLVSLENQIVTQETFVDATYS